METCPYTDFIMARTNTHKSPQAEASETVGQRLARLRKERGWTQVELAERLGIIQSLISDYERDRLRLNPAMVVRFAAALEITTDELLQPKAAQTVLRRLERIESLPQHQQNTLLKTIDGFLKGVAG